MSNGHSEGDSLTATEKQSESTGTTLFLAATLIRGRRTVLIYSLGFGAMALLPLILASPTFTATAAFAPQAGSESRTTGLASIAGQFGISVGATATSTQSPQFYASLLTNREVLVDLAQASFTDADGTAVALPTLIGIDESNPALRTEATIEKLTEDVIGYEIAKETGVITLRVKTKRPALSVAIADSLVSSVNRFNLRIRQSSATDERRFTEARLAEARAALRAIEDRLEAFLKANRQYQNSPELQFAADRLRREVSLNQDVVTSLTQAFEDVRIREVRDTPVISILQRPLVPAEPNPRPWLYLFLALPLGAVIGVMVVLTREIAARLRESGEPGAQVFLDAVDDVTAPLRRLRLLASRRASGG